MKSQKTTLEAAAAALQAAQEAVHVARRGLTAAIVNAYQAGEPVARIAERTGQDTTHIRNLLTATRALRQG